VNKLIGGLQCEFNCWCVECGYIDVFKTLKFDLSKDLSNTLKRNLENPWWSKWNSITSTPKLMDNDGPRHTRVITFAVLNCQQHTWKTI
jgi:hypothetical protein